MKKFFALILLAALITPLFSSQPIEVSFRNLKLVVHPDSGSFSLHQLSDVGKGRYRALIEDRNASATSWFSVQLDNKVFKLARKSGRSIEAERTDAGVRVVFTPTDDFQAIQIFTFIPAPGRVDSAFLKIETIIENTSGKTQTIALKALFDTLLGEASGIHFSTPVKKRISAETRINPALSRDAYISSRSEDASLEIFLDDSSASRPEEVYLANWDRLNTLTWKPDYLEGRSFNSIYSINDSAILFVWPASEIRANKTYENVMILGTDASVIIDAGSTSLAAPNSTTPVGTGLSEPIPLTENERLRQIREILTRIDELQRNPASTTDAELQALNQSLDVLLLNAPR